MELHTITPKNKRLRKWICDRPFFLKFKRQIIFVNGGGWCFKEENGLWASVQGLYPNNHILNLLPELRGAAPRPKRRA